MIDVEAGVFEEADRVQQASNLNLPLDRFSIAPENWAQTVADRARARPFCAMLLPSRYADASHWPSWEAFAPAILAGTFRVAFWGAAPERPFPLPALLIPSDRGPDVLGALLRHLGRAQLPGVSSILPEGARIYTEHVASDAEIGLKLDRILELAGKTDPRLASKAMTARLALSACLVAAFQEPHGTSVVKIQLGVAESFLAFSVKWRTSLRESPSWSSPRLPWSVALPFSDAFWVHLMPESSEAETLFLMDKAAQPSPRTRLLLPLGVDMITNARIESHKPGAAAPSFSGLQFRPLGADPNRKGSDLREIRGNGPRPEADAAVAVVRGVTEKSNDKATLVRGPEPALEGRTEPAPKDPKIEVANLRVENEKLLNALKLYREQVASLKKRLTEVIQQEQKARTEAKSRELDLNRKLALGHEQLKKLHRKAG